MGRELRRVPPDWAHPSHWAGHYQPLHDREYEEAAIEYLSAFMAWENGHNPKRATSETRYYWDWAGPPPKRDYYRPKWTVEPPAYQVYENVTEGTPVSPVFQTVPALRAWLLEQGHSELAADGFIAERWAPSMVVSSSGITVGIDAHDILSRAAEVPPGEQLPR